MPTTQSIKRPGLTGQERSSLQSKRIFFGHKSVGDNVIQGIRERMGEDPELRLNIVRSAQPEMVAGFALIEAHVGENGKPESKDKAFAAVLDGGMGAAGGIALYKYCYADIDSRTDPQRLFETYRNSVAKIKRKYPLLKIVHTTVPLTTVEPAAKAWLKGLLGKKTAQEANVRRNRFNKLLRQAYAGADPIFDLAEVESTRPDGSRSCFVQGGETVYTLAPEYTTDGGHLNRTGRTVAADHLLRLLAAL